MQHLALDIVVFVLDSQNLEDLEASPWKARAGVEHVERGLILSVDGQAIEQ